MATHKLPKIIQEQFDLQYDILKDLVYPEKEVTVISPELREKITKLKELSIKIKENPDIRKDEELPVEVENTIWSQILAELLRQGIDVVGDWMQPGKGVTLYNHTDSPIFVRTFDQWDNIRWIAYGSWTIYPNRYTTIKARGDTNIQADIGGRIFPCTIGVPHAYDGANVLGYGRGY